MKWFFGLSAKGAATSLKRSWNLIVNTVKHPVQFLRTVINFRWSSNLVILLVMQTVDNAMKMVWKKTAFGGRMVIDNSGNKKVPAYIPVGQEVMFRYADKVKGIPVITSYSIHYTKLYDLTALYISGRSAYWTHVGDTRIYLFRHNKLIVITSYSIHYTKLYD